MLNEDVRSEDTISHKVRKVPSSKLSAKGDSGDNVKLIWIISSGYQSHDLKEISLVAQQIMFTVVTYICLVSSSLDNFQSFS